MNPGLYTIGHSNHLLDKFLELLKKFQIEILADVRSHPYSKYATHFNLPSFKKSLHNYGIQYLYLGKELGGRPGDKRFYDSKGHVLYGLVAKSELFLDGMNRLIKEMTQHRIALMCSEENPVHCHRFQLIGRVLSDRGISLSHIRGDEQVQRDEDLKLSETQNKSGDKQPSLFGKTETSDWRSIKPILQINKNKD